MAPNLKTVMHARQLGPQVIAEELLARLFSQSEEFGLRCNLEQLPALRSAKIPLTLSPYEGPFAGPQR